MKLLYGKVAHERVEIVVHLRCRTHLPALGLLHGTAASQLTSCKDGDGLGRPDALKVAQLLHAEAPHAVEAIAIGRQHLLHQAHSRVFATARSYKNSKELSISQCLSSFTYHLLPWAIFFSPAVDGEFLHSEGITSSHDLRMNRRECQPQRTHLR